MAINICRNCHLFAETLTPTEANFCVKVRPESRDIFDSKSRSKNFPMLATSVTDFGVACHPMPVIVHQLDAGYSRIRNFSYGSSGIE